MTEGVPDTTPMLTRSSTIHHKDTPLANLPQYPPGFLHLTVPVDDSDQFINVFNKIVARLDGDRGTSITGYHKLLTSPAFAKQISENSRKG